MIYISTAILDAHSFMGHLVRPNYVVYLVSVYRLPVPQHFVASIQGVLELDRHWWRSLASEQNLLILYMFIVLVFLILHIDQVLLLPLLVEIITDILYNLVSDLLLNIATLNQSL